MTRMTTQIDAALAMLRRDTTLFVSYRLRFFTQVLGTFFSMTLFYYVSRLVRVEQFPSPDAYYAYVVVGLIILQVLNSTLASPPGAVRSELLSGTFERILLSPFGPLPGLVSLLIFPCLLALMIGAVMVAFAALVFGLDLQWTTAWLAFPLGILGAMAFAPFGMLLLAVVLVSKQAPTGTTWIVAAISLIAGLYFPVTLLPDWIEWASEVQPFTPAVELLRNVLVGTPMSDPLWLALAKLVGFSTVLWPGAIWVANRAIAAGQRRGTIIEY